MYRDEKCIQSICAFPDHLEELRLHFSCNRLVIFGVVYEVDIVTICLKWSLVREEHRLFLFMRKAWIYVFIHVHGREFFETNYCF
jgi:hypothetical protein